MSLAGCDGTAPVEPTPEPEPLRTVLFYRHDNGQTFFINTDGSDRQRVALGGDSLLPLAVSANGAMVALLGSRELLIRPLQGPGVVDTAIRPVPAEMSLAGFSPDGNLLALVSYAPTERLLVYDRVSRRLDSLRLPSPLPSLPPIFASDNNRIALISVTVLSAFLTIVQRDRPETILTERLGFSRILNRPVFGWPIWLDDGIHLALVRLAQDAPDTVLSVRIDPDRPGAEFEERYRAVLAPVSDQRPKVRFGIFSTYAYARSARSFVLGAQPSADSSRHAIYLVTRTVPRVQLILDNPAEFPVFPLVIN